MHINRSHPQSLCWRQEDSFQSSFHWHLNPLRLGNKATAPFNTALQNSTSDSESNRGFLIFLLQHLCVQAPAWTHLRYVHLLHLGQSRGLEQDARARWRPGPGLGHGQVDARSRFDIARTSLSQAGQRAKCWGKRNQNTDREQISLVHRDHRAVIQYAECTAGSILKGDYSHFET